MKSLLFVCLFFQSLNHLAYGSQPLWIDYDLSFGKLIHEVDDGFALYHALKSSDQFDLKGLSTVHGNTKDMRHQMKTSKKILKLMGRTDLAVYTGAASATELGNRTPASGALIKALEQGPLTIVAIGRLTNIATVLLLRPDLIDNIQEIIVNAGRRLEYAPLFGRRKINFPDTNVDGDPIAFKVLEELRAPLTMIPTESMKTSLWLKGQIRQMRRSKDPMLRWLGRKSRLWRWVWKIFLGGPGFIPWDLFAISYLTHREDFKCHLDIPWKIQELPNNTHSLFRWKKRPKSKLFLVSSFNITSKNTGTYCYNIRSGHLDRLLNQWIR